MKSCEVRWNYFQSYSETVSGCSGFSQLQGTRVFPVLVWITSYYHQHHQYYHHHLYDQHHHHYDTTPWPSSSPPTPPYSPSSPLPSTTIGQTLFAKTKCVPPLLLPWSSTVSLGGEIWPLLSVHAFPLISNTFVVFAPYQFKCTITKKVSHLNQHLLNPPSPPPHPILKCIVIILLIKCRGFCFKKDDTDGDRCLHCYTNYCTIVQTMHTWNCPVVNIAH